MHALDGTPHCPSCPCRHINLLVALQASSSQLHTQLALPFKDQSPPCTTCEKLAAYSTLVVLLSIRYLASAAVWVPAAASRQVSKSRPPTPLHQIQQVNKQADSLHRISPQKPLSRAVHCPRTMWFRPVRCRQIPYQHSPVHSLYSLHRYSLKLGNDVLLLVDSGRWCSLGQLINQVRVHPAPFTAYAGP